VSISHQNNSKLQEVFNIYNVYLDSKTRNHQVIRLILSTGKLIKSKFDIPGKLQKPKHYILITSYYT